MQKGLPPTIIFHGKKDTTVPYRTVKIFASKAKANGDYMVLEGYDEQGHGFFNYGRNDHKMYEATIQKLDEFFVNIGFLQGT